MIQEAFAAGIPVIASDVYGNAEQVKDGENGFLFKFMDEDSLKSVVKRIIMNPAILDKMNVNVSKIKSKGFADIAAEYVQIYSKN